jgi:hypothetical protein
MKFFVCRFLHGFQIGNVVLPAFYAVGVGDSFSRVYSGWGVNPSSHFYMMPDLRMRGAVPPTPILLRLLVLN